jgi:Bardet-Biedl syndrome 2 protein
VSANFPEEQEKIGELLQKVSALQDVRLRLGAEVADHSGLIRSLVVRAEDARHLDDM